ncbi:hypothetical protein TD95_004522 [Thielaviopsis punctulata]|uniref:F-box domain-containing protein n=1 Tax=Thielaviopsis punctulata TaxID=72032 RepID=A0A0F4Z711_9PEZI|nr:hypothetical protein TD95_004522 [Thielaviopsis punctulata]
MTTGFLDLPNEIIHLILAYISPEDNLCNVQLVNRLLHFLASDNRLWKLHCSSIGYWSPHHDIQNKMQARLDSVKWKRLYVLRKKRNHEAERLMSKAVESRQGRMLRLEQMSVLGPDVKDYLLDQIGLKITKHEDALARQFHANISLASMHRAMAISRWLRFSPHKMTGNAQSIVAQFQNYAKRPWAPGDLEEIMTGLDMFAPTLRSRDISWLIMLKSSQTLDKITQEFRNDNPDFARLSTREKATRINVWLRYSRYTGIKAEGRTFYYLRCAFLGQALAFDDHVSIPLIQCVIYCCVATRLGLKADCCMFPGKLHVIVQAPRDQYLDGPSNSYQPPSQDERHLIHMFLSPYDCDTEISLRDLERSVTPWGFHPGTDGILQPMNPADVILRNARNIQSNCERIQRMDPNVGYQASLLLESAGYNNVITSSYAAQWIQVLFTPMWDPSFRTHATNLLERVRSTWPEDYWIVQRFFPPFDSSGLSRTKIGPHSPTSTMMPYRPSDVDDGRDDTRVVPRYRDADGGPAKYRVGQVFQHARYSHIGVITGWLENRMSKERRTAVGGSADAVVQEEPEVKIFYYCLAGPNAIPALVTEDNIRIVTNMDALPFELFNRCGKYFKNFDMKRYEFVSNIKDEYPDD